MTSSVQPTVVSGNVGKTTAIIKCEAQDDYQPFNGDAFAGTSKVMNFANYPVKNQNFGINTENLDCVVCGDRATGKHYGAISCDGCKGFFRRSVRKNPIYECRHQNNCIIDKDKRNQCRHCRLKKCILMGMKKEAVQKERDRLGRPRNSHHVHGAPTIKTSPRIPGELDDNDDDDDLSVMALLKAERTAQEYIGRQIRVDRHTLSEERIQANLETICISMNYQLRSLIEWAKDLKSFSDLSDNDKIALLRGHTGENLVLGVACRSLKCDDYLLLGNHYIIPRNTSDIGLARAASRILDEIVKPLKEIELDEKEYACLKAIVFFDNDNKSLSDPTRVRSIRKRIQVNLENYINQHRLLTPGRFGDMLLLLPPLQNIARMMVDSVARYNQDTKQVDDLINEMLLNRYLDDCQEAVISTTTKTMPCNNYATSSSPSNSISKENDLDSNASSIDTDMEDNLSQDLSQQYDSISSGTATVNPVMLVPSTVDDDLQNVSLTEHDDYLSNNLAHIHILNPTADNETNMINELSTTLHSDRNDPMLDYFSNEPIKSNSSKPIDSVLAATSYDSNSEMTFLCDLMTPPTSTTLQDSRMTSSSSNSHFYNADWNN